MNDPQAFFVTERTYSWGTLVNAYRYGICVVTVDVYVNGDYHVWNLVDSDY